MAQISQYQIKNKLRKTNEMSEGNKLSFWNFLNYFLAFFYYFYVSISTKTTTFSDSDFLSRNVNAE